MIAFQHALQLTLEKIRPLGTESISISFATGRVAAKDLAARVDLPSIDVSLKDGYAIRSADVSCASPQSPKSLKLIGDVAAGGHWQGVVKPGTAVRILSGAPIPEGAEAVISEEFTRLEDEKLIVMADAHPGRNILSKGRDIRRGQALINAGEVMQPAQVGLLAAGGYDRIAVIKNPRVGIIATGDEVIAPGKPLEEGKLYASNLVTLASWCHRYGVQVDTWVVKDQRDALRSQILKGISDHDLLLTSGGAWSGDHDLVVGLLDDLGWNKYYHRVRIGPGKAVGFGLLDGKPVFCLPGGPPSNYMAFLNLALPGLLKLSGRQQTGLPTLTAQLGEEVRGQKDWTQFILGTFAPGDGAVIFHPLKMESRLQMMAKVDGFFSIPEGQDHIKAGETIKVSLLKAFTDWGSFD